MEPIIKVKDLHFAYGDKPVLDGVSFGIVNQENRKFTRDIIDTVKG